MGIGDRSFVVLGMNPPQQFSGILVYSVGWPLLVSVDGKRQWIDVDDRHRRDCPSGATSSTIYPTIIKQDMIQNAQMKQMTSRLYPRCNHQRS